MKERYYSLDVFRGATVALMILVNNPGSWSHIYPPFEHAAWHGCTPTDLVFPFFLFAVGNAMAFVLPRLREKGTAAFMRKLFTRSLLIFAIGLFLNWSPFIKWDNDHLIFKPWANIRIFGVLQRIALCYFFASFIFVYSSRFSFLFALFYPDFSSRSIWYFLIIWRVQRIVSGFFSILYYTAFIWAGVLFSFFS